MAINDVSPIGKALSQLKVNILKGDEPMPFVVRKYEKGAHIPKCVHQHPEAEVCFMPWDAGVMLVDGMAHPFCPGDMFLIPGNTYHHPVFDSSSNRGLKVVYFSPHFINQIPPAWLDLRAFLSSPGNSIKLAGNVEAAHLMLDMELLLQAGEKENEIKCQGIFLHLMSYFATELRLKRSSLQQGQEALMKKFSQTLNYIHTNLSSSIDVTQLHRQAGLSRSRFCEQFKACFGVSATQYIQQARLDKSKYLLRSTQLSITEIAYTCGYNWPSFFNRIFKKSIGVSPSEFRKNGIGKIVELT